MMSDPNCQSRLTPRNASVEEVSDSGDNPPPTPPRARTVVIDAPRSRSRSRRGREEDFFLDSEPVHVSEERARSPVPRIQRSDSLYGQPVVLRSRETVRRVTDRSARERRRSRSNAHLTAVPNFEPERNSYFDEDLSYPPPPPIPNLGRSSDHSNRFIYTMGGNDRGPRVRLAPHPAPSVPLPPQRRPSIPLPPQRRHVYSDREYRYHRRRDPRLEDEASNTSGDSDRSETDSEAEFEGVVSKIVVVVERPGSKKTVKKQIGISAKKKNDPVVDIDQLRAEVEQITRLNVEEERRSAEEAKRRAVEERTKLEAEVRENIEAENRAAAEAKDAEARRLQEFVTLTHEKLQQSVDEIVSLARDKVRQELENGLKEEPAAQNVRRARLPRDKPIMTTVETDDEEAEAHQCTRREHSRANSHPSDFSAAREAPSSTRRRQPNAPSDEPRSPLPRVPEVPGIDSNLSRSDNQSSVTSNRRTSRWRTARGWEEEHREQDSDDYKERRRLRRIREELILPIADVLVTGLAGRAYPYAPPGHQYYGRQSEGRRRRESEYHMSEILETDLDSHDLDTGSDRGAVASRRRQDKRRSAHSSTRHGNKEPRSVTPGRETAQRRSGPHGLSGEDTAALSRNPRPPRSDPEVHGSLGNGDVDGPAVEAAVAGPTPPSIPKQIEHKPNSRSASEKDSFIGAHHDEAKTEVNMEVAPDDPRKEKVMFHAAPVQTSTQALSVEDPDSKLEDHSSQTPGRQTRQARSHSRHDSRSRSRSNHADRTLTTAKGKGGRGRRKVADVGNRRLALVPGQKYYLGLVMGRNMAVPFVHKFDSRWPISPIPWLWQPGPVTSGILGLGLSAVGRNAVGSVKPPQSSSERPE